MSLDMVQLIDNVEYELLGNDFDHKGVTLILGGGKRPKKENIFNSTLAQEYTEIIGKMGAYETLNEHMRVRNLNVQNSMGRLEVMWRENELWSLITRSGGVINNEDKIRWENNKTRINEILSGWPTVGEIIEGGVTCNYKTLFEVTLMGIKNRLIAKQWAEAKEEIKDKKDLELRMRLVENLNGKESLEYRELERGYCDLLTRDLKRRAGKYKEFFEKNNEKPTRAFFRIGRTKNLDDNTKAIKNDNGEEFENEASRGKYIGETYGKLYRKKIDKMLEFVNYLTELNGQLGNEKRGLTEEQKNGLEGEFTLEELEKSLEKSNMDSAAGWDGISYCFIKKILEYSRAAIGKGNE
jgi:hypothetical protein